VDDVGVQPQLVLRMAVSFRVRAVVAGVRGSAPASAAHGGVLPGEGGSGGGAGVQPQLVLRMAASFRVRAVVAGVRGFSPS
jgi:hypothetical protein